MVHRERTDEQLAKLAGVSRDTIRKVKVIEQAKAKERELAGGEGREISHTLRSDEATAEQFGISANTMRRGGRKNQATLTEAWPLMWHRCGTHVAR